MWEYNHAMNSDELYHYGVLGMRWGIRKARSNGTSYTYKSKEQKKFEKKLNKQVKSNTSSEKVYKTEKKLDAIKKRDAERQRYAESTSLGKLMVQQMLMGSYDAGTYQRYRAAGNSVMKAYIKTKLASNYLGWPLSVGFSKRSEIRSAKKK